MGQNQGPDFPTQFVEKGVAPGYQGAGGHNVKEYVQQKGFHYHEPGKVPTFAEFEDEEAERVAGEKQDKDENPELWAKQQTKQREHALEKQEADAEWAVWRQKHGKLTRQETPSYPVSLLKYMTVGQPPAPGLPFRTWFFDRFTSPKTTSSLLPNFFTTAFHSGACFTHQPQPSLAIHLTKTVLPASTLVLMKSS